MGDQVLDFVEVDFVQNTFRFLVYVHFYHVREVRVELLRICCSLLDDVLFALGLNELGEGVCNVTLKELFLNLRDDNFV